MDILTLKLSKNYTDKKALGLVVKVVDVLPTTGANSTIYLVPNSGSGSNIYDEYIWIADQNKYEKIGTTDIDLTGYATKEYVENKGYLVASSHKTNETPIVFTDSTGTETTVWVHTQNQ